MNVDDVSRLARCLLRASSRPTHIDYRASRLNREDLLTFETITHDSILHVPDNKIIGDKRFFSAETRQGARETCAKQKVDDRSSRLVSVEMKKEGGKGITVSRIPNRKGPR